MSDPPFLPGYTTPPIKPGELRNQQLKVIKDHMVRNRPNEKLIDIQIEQTQKRLDELKARSRPFPTISQDVESKPEEELSIVLCYFAYFQQSVTESNLENYRVRYVRILRYLDDDTWMIEEHPTRNSQIPQGKLLRRGCYDIGPIEVGQNILIHEVVFHVYDCDDFTRYYLTKNGQTVAPREDIPDDLYTLRRKLTDRPIRIKHMNIDKTNLRNFLDYDGKVLRFWACWDDREAVFGEKRNFTFIYFLVDGRCEVRQILPPNSGRDPVERFLKKTYLKKNDGSLFTDADLFIGNVVDVLGRKFLLYDCDDFTKEFLNYKHGPRDWTPIAIDDFGLFSQKIPNPS